MDLRQEICAAYCSYYKPGKEQEETCRGFAVLQRHPPLWKHLPRILQTHHAEGWGSEIHDALAGLICASCPFHENDCDFVQHVEGAVPCGGFIVLGLLLESGDSTIDNIREIV
jgi:hypothetical protein